MLIEHYEELGKDRNNLNRKQVLLFEKYIKDNKIPQEDVYDNVNPFIDSFGYAKSTRKNYRYSLRVYVEDVAYNNWED